MNRCRVRVMQVRGDRALVQRDASGCGGCAVGCRPWGREATHWVTPPQPCRPGDVLTLEIADGRVAWAAAGTYGVLFAGLMAGLFTGDAMLGGAWGDGGAAAGGLIGLVGAAIGMRHLTPS